MFGLYMKEVDDNELRSDGCKISKIEEVCYDDDDDCRKMYMISIR